EESVFTTRRSDDNVLVFTLLNYVTSQRYEVDDQEYKVTSIRGWATIPQDRIIISHANDVKVWQINPGSGRKFLQLVATLPQISQRSGRLLYLHPGRIVILVTRGEQQCLQIWKLLAGDGPQEVECDSCVSLSRQVNEDWFLTIHRYNKEVQVRDTKT